MSVSPTVLAKLTRSPTLTKKSCMAHLASASLRGKYKVNVRPAALPFLKAHDAVAGKRRNFGSVEPQLGEHILGLRAERLRRQANRRRLAVIAHWMIDQRQRHAALACPLSRHQRLHVLDLRIAGDLGVVAHARVPDLRPLHALDPLLRDFALQPC